MGGLKESDVSLDQCSPCESLLLQVTENPTTVASGNGGFSDCIRILWRHPHILLPVDTSVHTSQSSKGQNVQLFESFLQSRSSLCPWGGMRSAVLYRLPRPHTGLNSGCPEGSFLITHSLLPFFSSLSPAPSPSSTFPGITY